MSQANKRELTIARIRMAVQAAFTLICLFAGYRFYQFYLWATGQSQAYVSRPPSVEGFLPISALLGFKRFLLTGKWDEVHPAGLTIFVFALATALLLRKAFCGWICPVGFASILAARLGKKLRLTRELPKWLDLPLLGVKYLLLAFFGYIILWQMNVGMIEGFLSSQYNLVVDARMLLFFLHPAVMTLKVLGVLLIVSLVVRNFWCRCLCPYGALLGLGALFSLFQIKRDASLCINCGKCESVCPAAIHITRSRTILHPECVGCAECVEVCPKNDCLSLQTFTSKKRLHLYAMPVAVVGLFLIIWTVALVSGHWHTAIPLDIFRRLYPDAAAVGHP
jgi:polyferredoxin